MTKQLNNELINKLAVKYAETKSEEILVEILEQARPMIYNEAVKAERRYGIDREDMVSEYMQDVWEAVKSESALRFDGSSNFTQRFHSFFKKSLLDKLRHNNREMRSAMTTVSMDSTIRTNGIDSGGDDRLECTTLKVLSQQIPLEEAFFSNEWVNETLAGFLRSNERDAMIIQMVYDGYEKVEIAQALGSPTYDANVRQTVSRAKAKFKKFIENQNPLSA